MRTELPTGTVTFLFTDIEGSTRLLHALGPDGYAEALAEHRRIVREAFTAHGGVEVDTQGDAFFVSFPTAEGAAQAALDAQQALASGPIAVRMGVHTGAPTVTAEGYVGIDVHRGARVAALAHGGQVVCSATTAALLDGHPLRDLGLHRLKDFEGATRLFQLGEGDFPPLRSPGSVELPTPATRFLGRERELFEAVSLVYERDPRVLTVLGPGGTGKTRFTLELCRLLAEDAEGGTVFVPLAPLRDPELVLPAIAERLGAEAADPAAIAARVGSRRTHALLDNLEHLLPAAARSLAALVAEAPALRLFVTSREALRIQGEVELDLPPLADDEAVALFLERAHAVRPELEEDDAVSQLCRRLDRLPLALELAAARTKLLSPAALLERLGASLDLLEGTRDADERHATLRATIAWSYELLTDEERRLFRRLSVFLGGCTLESAETVCEADLDTLASLLDKSLLRRRTGRLGEERYWLLETIREFAAEELEASGEADAVRRRHAERMLVIARAASLSEDDDEPPKLELALAERDDLRAALDWAAGALHELALELFVLLETFWNAHARDEGSERASEFLATSGSLAPLLRARALRVVGNTLYFADKERAFAAWQESLRLFRELGDDRGVALVLHRLALYPLDCGDVAEARRLVDESQALAQGRFSFVELVNLMVYSEIAHLIGDVEEEMRLKELGVQVAEELGWDWWESSALYSLSQFAFQRGDLDGAEGSAAAALVIARRHENRVRAATTLAALAQVALARGDLERAGALWGCAQGELARHSSLRALDLEDVAGDLHLERDPDFVAALESGREHELWEVVENVLGELAPSQTVP